MCHSAVSRNGSEVGCTTTNTIMVIAIIIFTCWLLTVAYGGLRWLTVAYGGLRWLDGRLMVA
jgi:hypothetical protein